MFDSTTICAGFLPSQWLIITLDTQPSSNVKVCVITLLFIAEFAFSCLEFIALVSSVQAPAIASVAIWRTQACDVVALGSHLIRFASVVFTFVAQLYRAIYQDDAGEVDVVCQAISSGGLPQVGAELGQLLFRYVPFAHNASSVSFLDPLEKNILQALVSAVLRPQLHNLLSIHELIASICQAVRY